MPRRWRYTRTRAHFAPAPKGGKRALTYNVIHLHVRVDASCGLTESTYLPYPAPSSHRVLTSNSLNEHSTCTTGSVVHGFYTPTLTYYDLIGGNLTTAKCKVCNNACQSINLVTRVNRLILPRKRVFLISGNPLPHTSSKLSTML